MATNSATVEESAVIVCFLIKIRRHQNDDLDEEIYRNETNYLSNSRRRSRHKQIKMRNHCENGM